MKCINLAVISLLRLRRSLGADATSTAARPPPLILSTRRCGKQARLDSIMQEVMTSQLDVMNLINLPPRVFGRTHLGGPWLVILMSKFQGSSYRKHWCANCRLPVPSEEVPCPTCGVRSEVMSSDRVAPQADSSRSRSRDEGQDRQPVAGAAEDHGLHLPPIGSSAHNVASQSPFRKLRNFLSPGGRLRNLSGSSNSSNGSDGPSPLPPVASRNASGARSMRQQTSYTAHRTGEPVRFPTLTSQALLRRDLAIAKETGDYRHIQAILVNTFSSWEELNTSFKDHLVSALADEYHYGMDMNFIHWTYSAILLMPHDVRKAVLKAIIAGLLGESETRHKTKNHLRAYLILLENPQFRAPNTYIIFAHLLRQLSLMADQHHRRLVCWFRSYPMDHFKALVEKVNLFISVRLFPPHPADLPPPPKCAWWIPSAIKVLAVLNAANNLAHPPLIPYTDFYNAALDHTDLMTEYYAWQSPQGFVTMRFSFCQYPFVLSMAAKKMILQRDSEHQMLAMAKKSLLEKAQRHQMPSVGNLFLNLHIRRTHIVQDSLTELIVKRHDLKKKVKVTFAGEPGLDWGGLTKEWFLLLVRKIFQPDFGMFTYCAESGNYWFNMASIDAESEFHLIGILMGLAVYNSTILDIRLPLSCYKKLLSPLVVPSRSTKGVPVGATQLGLQDLKEVMPSLAAGLEALLQYEGDVAEDFCYTFQVSYQAYGDTVTIDLKPGGKDIRVTKGNREEFVSLYTDFLLNKSIYNQFASFFYGFHRVCTSNALQLFRPEEIELLVCGSPLLDLSALEDVALYDGFSKEDSTVRHFWEIVASMSEEQQKKLLLFVTGSDRVPVGGVSEMKFKICKVPFQNTGRNDMLPLAHTCFNQLLIPPYKSKRKLKEKLLIAINNSEGFGLE